MANYRAVASGNWSNIAIWQDDSSGSFVASTVFPGASDNVYSNTFTVNVDQNITVNAIANSAITGVTAGGVFDFNTSGVVATITTYGIAAQIFRVTATSGTVEIISTGYFFSFSFSSAIVHTGNCDFTLRCLGIVTNGANVTGVGKSGTGTFTIYGDLASGGNGSAGAVTYNISVSNGNLIVYGNVFATAGRGGGANIICNSVNSSLTVYGGITGQSSTYANPAVSWTAAAGIITVSGSVVGGNGHGITTNAVCIVTGSVTGGTTSTFSAVNTTNTLYVTGDVAATSLGNAVITTAPVVVYGNVTANSAPSITSTSAMFVNVSGSVYASATANAISLTNASAVVNLAGNMYNVSGKQAIYCQNLFLSNTDTTTAQFFTIGSQDRTLYSADTFPNLPSTSNVRFGTTYGPGSGNTGTLRMASPQDVRSGVLTDNTTGSAILSIESLSNEVQTSTDPFAQRLRDIPTVDIIGNLLTAFKK